MYLHKRRFIRFNTYFATIQDAGSSHHLHSLRKYPGSISSVSTQAPTPTHTTTTTNTYFHSRTRFNITTSEYHDMAIPIFNDASTTHLTATYSITNETNERTNGHTIERMIARIKTRQDKTKQDKTSTRGL